jgi:transposase
VPDDRSADSPPTPNEIDALRERAERAEREREALRREVERLRRENERLREELEAARRAGCRQAAPFSKNRPSPHPRRPGRKAGPAYGRPAHRPVPLHIDETHDAPLPAVCPHCTGPVVETAIATQHQEDLPPVRPIVRAFHVHIGQCQRCGRRLQGRHPLQTSDALGAAAAQIGPRVVATAAVLHKQFGLPVGKVASLLQQHFALTITAGGLVHALHRAARQTAPTYAALIETVRQSPVVVPDETGWRVGAELQWLWVYATPNTTVYAIQPGRGFEQAAAVLGADYAGVLVRDGWAPYRQFEQAAHQTCLAHLLRRCRELQTDHPRAPFPYQVQDVLQQMLQVRDRYTAGTISAHGLAVVRGQLQARLTTFLDQPTTVPAVRRFATHLDREWPALFSCLHDPTIDATNWRAEQALRPAVVNRKVSGGNRTWLGAQTQQVLATLFRTSRQRGLDPLSVLGDLLRDRLPRIAAALFPT